MVWLVSFVIALVIIALGIIFLAEYRRIPFCKKHLDATRILICIVFLSAAALFYPVYQLDFKGTSFVGIKSVLLSFHNAIRLFVVDGDFQFVFDKREFINPAVAPFYELLMGVLFVMAPILTFSFVLSFFKDLRASIKLYFNRHKDTYVFSEMNEKSVLLAESIFEKDPKSIIVFTDVFANGGEEFYELLQRVNIINGITLKKDITRINFSKHSTKKELVFFICSDIDEEETEHFVKLHDMYLERENCFLYFFSSSFDTELLNRSLDNSKGKVRSLKVRRVNDSVQLVFNYLYENGVKLFEDSKAVNNHVSVIINGLDNYGKEMLKALTWFLQMKGYTFEINCFDEASDAKDIISREIPEVFSCAEGTNPNDSSNRYNIKVHSGINFDSTEYYKKISGIKNPTFVFTSLGSDKKNIEVLSSVKNFIDGNYFKKNTENYEICRFVAIVKNPTENSVITKYLGGKYELIGDYKSIYSYDFISMCEMENDGLNRHMNWGGLEHDYYGNEYNYKSSISSAIHIKVRSLLNIPGANKKPSERSDFEKDIISRIEHNRWSAYIRTEGFTYNEVRNNKLKFHNCLVPYEMLSDEQKAKDNI